MGEAIRDVEVPLVRGAWARGRGPVMLCLAGVVLAACGGATTPEIEPSEPSGQGVVAPECQEVDRLEAVLPEGAEPTGTTAGPVEDDSMPDGQTDGGTATAPEARSLGPEIQAWAEQEAPDSFAGVWVDQELGGYAVAFAEDVGRYAAEVRERFHPGLAVAEADHSYAQLRALQERIDQEQMDTADESGAVRSSGTQVMINRVTVGVFDPDDERLHELSEIYGATAICFEIQAAPSPPGEGIETLAKATDWRDGLAEELGQFGVFEVAYDLETAEAAWRDNVPDDLEPRDDELPADPGVYGELDEVDFDQQAVVVWSSGESGSCPEWLSDIDHADGSIVVERERSGGMCTDDYNPYRVVLAVDRERLPSADELPSARLDGVPDGEVRIYPAAEG